MKTYLDYKTEEECLYKTEFPDEGYIVWKPLLWSEFKRYKEARDFLGPQANLQIEEAVFSRAVLFSSYDLPPPEQLDQHELVVWEVQGRLDQPAGVISTIVKLVLAKSGEQNPRNIIPKLERARLEANAIEAQLEILICKAFPSYKPEDIHNMPWETVLKRAAQAELILGAKLELADGKQGQEQGFDLDREMREVGREFSQEASPEEIATERARRKAMLEQKTRVMGGGRR